MPLNRLDNTGQPIQPPPDVQRTTMSLDVMGRFVCNTWDEAIDNGGTPFDAIVIGGGMFGGYAASRIARSTGTRALRVLVLEAGPFLLPTHMQNLPRSGLNVPSPMLPSKDNGIARDLVWGVPWRSNVPWVGQAFCVGGKSLYWGGWCPRLEDDDLATWPPSVVQYLQTFYGRLEQQLGVDKTTDFIQGELYELLRARVTELVGAGIPGATGVEPPPLAVQGQSPASGLFAFDKFSSVTLLIDAVRQAAGQSDSNRRLFIVPNVHVTRLESHDGIVTGLHAFVDGTARHLPIAPDCSVILAAGMIESTRLALLSFPTSTNGQPEMIGRHLVSHVRSNMKFRVRRSALDRNGTLSNELQAGALLVRGRGTHGKFHIQVTASADASGDPDALLYTMIPDIDQLQALLAMQNAGWIAFFCRGASEMEGDIAMPVPNATGSWINLSPFEADEFGMPRAYVSMNTTPADDALAATMDQCMIALAHGLANGNPDDLEIMANPFRDALGSTYHEGGTLWMGTDPASSVTDTNGRFHHIANAYVADQSLFVTAGSVNPVLTGMTLARKVTDAVIAKAQGQPAPA